MQRKRLVLLGALFVALVAIVYTANTKTLTKQPVNEKPAEPTYNARLGSLPLLVEYAKTLKEWELGLSGRKFLPIDHGLLFVFEKPGRYGFWMKDMLFPIDIVWMDPSYRVIAIAPDLSPSTYPETFYPPVPVLYVLEINAGLVQEYNIATGTVLTLSQ